MENQLIKISKKNFDHYTNIADVIDKLKTAIQFINKEYTQQNYQDFGLKFNNIINDNITFKDKLKFKQFVADIKNDDIIIEVNYQTYEKFIIANNILNQLRKLDEILGIENFTWGWRQYVTTVSKILED